MEYSYIKNFTSKRNSVNLIDLLNSDNTISKVVLKQFNNNECFFKELEVCNVLTSNYIYVPKILKIQNTDIFYEHIDGTILIDLLEMYENGNYTIDIFSVFDKLFIWLKQCYSILNKHYNKNMILGDCHLRNFIYYDEKIYGVDFESVKEGVTEQDIAYLCILTLTYSPMFTKSKYEIASYILQQCTNILNLDKNILKNELHNQLEIICNRRNLKISDDVIDKLFTII